jgi:uncharacterized membrane protein YkvA (DUF1232 family)
MISSAYGMDGRQSYGDAFDAEQAARDEARVRRGFWPKLRRSAAHLPLAEEFVAAYYCAFDRRSPRRVQAILLGALAYFVLPFDFVPDMLPLIGFTDDAAVLVTAIKVVAAHITPEHREAARALIARLREGERTRPT